MKKKDQMTMNDDLFYQKRKLLQGGLF